MFVQGPRLITSFVLSDSTWPSISNRPTVSGSTLSWVGPLGGGANNGQPVQQSRTLTASGNVSTSSDNQVIQGLDISGTVSINHNNVTLKQCRVTISDPTGSAVHLASDPISGTVIEDCQINGSMNSFNGLNCPASTFSWSAAAVRRNYLLGFENCITGNPHDTPITDNLIGPMGNSGSSTYDGDGIELYTCNNITIRHNTFISTGSQTTNLVLNSLVNMTSVSGNAVTNITIDSNHFEGSSEGSFVIDFDNSPGGPMSWNCTNNGFINIGSKSPVRHAADYIAPSPNSGNYTSADINSTGGSLLNGTGQIS